MYDPCVPMQEPLTCKKYIHTFEPVRKTRILEEEDEDPIVLIKQRVYG